jgi:hypothetical protein
MDANSLDNDTRGWIMTALSGIGESVFTMQVRDAEAM